MVQPRALVGNEPIGCNGDIFRVIVKANAVSVDDATSRRRYHAGEIGQMFSCLAHRVAHSGNHRILQLIEVSQGVCALQNEPLGSRSGRLDTLTGHIVQDGHIAFVSDAHNHGQGELSDIGRQVIVVE